ncbi:Alpha/Beta hydrolase protein [Mucor mucedo]|uniref:Alpha/Beta hydrolase protein n=1 Tax=Mucor mucedo TaxID=29922 RepID=UPI00221FAB7F|nr:Alpha/Beta hydrolase protein [Mucor mucedo]KAI7894251.1 Alpha/Beta hydrolase protein [Mucor mucedo]
MIPNALKWLGIGLITSYVMGSFRTPLTLDSLSVKPFHLYSPDFYPNGSYLELPQGTMRYWKFGNEDGNRVVLVHGITTGSSVYDRLARDLANDGHHVLVYDLWGRGYSQAPPTVYNEALYTSQLAMLLQKVGWDNADIIGVSLGGAIATSFTSFYPEMVNKLVLIAPAGLQTRDDMPLIAKFLALPFVHQFLMNQPYIRPILVHAVEKYSRSTRVVENGLDPETEAIIQKITKIATYQFVNHPGFFRAFIGTAVEYPFTGLSPRYKTVGKLTDLSVLIIWGDQDTTVPFKRHKEAQAFIPNSKLIVYKGRGHDVLITRWRSVNKDIETFLQAS